MYTNKFCIETFFLNKQKNKIQKIEKNWRE